MNDGGSGVSFVKGFPPRRTPTNVWRFAVRFVDTPLLPRTAPTKEGGSPETFLGKSETRRAFDHPTTADERCREDDPFHSAS